MVARILRDAGYEVIYTGLFQTPDTVAAAAVDEDVDAIGLSMLSGAHMTLAPLVVEKVRGRGADIPVVVGGIVPNRDVHELESAGVAKILTPGATADEVVEAIRSAIHPTRARTDPPCQHGGLTASSDSPICWRCCSRRVDQ